MTFIDGRTTSAKHVPCMPTHPFLRHLPLCSSSSHQYNTIKEWHEPYLQVFSVYQYVHSYVFWATRLFPAPTGVEGEFKNPLEFLSRAIKRIPCRQLFLFSLLCVLFKSRAYWTCRSVEKCKNNKINWNSWLILWLIL